MKKSLLALAVLGAFAGAAHAQSAVTIYGSFDAGVRHVTNAGGTSDSVTTMSSAGTYNSNRIGFKGTEDLGGGMNAHFVLETGFNTGNGALAGDLFGRSAYVGLGGSWGSLDLGRQYTVIFKTIGAYDPFNYKYTGIIPLAGLDGARHNNSIQYTGNFGPVTGRLEYALGEVAGETSAASNIEAGVTYAGGPFSVGAAYGKGKPNAGTAAAPNYQDSTDWTIGGAYATGPFRVAAGYNNRDNDAPAATATRKDYWLGGSYNVSPAASVSAAYYYTKAENQAGADGKQKLFVIGATYALSKRTNFYADIDHAKLDGLLNVGRAEDTTTGISVGINHLF